MKIEKKHWIIIAIVVVLIALWYFFMKKKPATTSNYAGMYGSFGNESNWLGNAQYYDCHRKCMNSGNSVSTCDQQCGRGTKGASAMKVKVATSAGM